MLATIVLCSGSFAACTPTAPVAAPPTTQQPIAMTPRIIPAPASITVASGDAFMLSVSAQIVIDPGNAEVSRTAELLAAIMRPSTGFAIPVSTGASSGGAIVLRLSTDAALGEEGYRLTVSRDSVRITANAPAGLFRGTQTLRQLLPAQIESHMKMSQRSWPVPAVTISDQPRFAWRGVMLDVARHFFTVDEVKQYIDLIALYKLNVLHLHLSDDQGWRIEIKSQPQLTAAASVTEVGGGPGGFYTQSDYAEIVRYALDRYITTVPEIDMPGHTNAALIAHPELSCSRRPPALYTGTEVGWSTFCANNEGTYAFIDVRRWSPARSRSRCCTRPISRCR